MNLDPWLRRAIVRKRPWTPPPTPWTLFGLGGFAVFEFYALLVWAGWMVFPWGINPPGGYWPGALLWGGVLALVASLASVMIPRSGEDYWMSLGPFLRQLGAQAVILTSVLIITVGLPAAVIAAGGEWRPIDPTAAAIPDFSVDVDSSGTGQVAPGGGRLFSLALAWVLSQEPSNLIGNGLQLSFITSLSLLPALLFFIFDRQKVSTLRSQFFRSVVLIDPDVRTQVHAESVYGARADDSLGPETRRKGAPIQGAPRQVVILTTTLLVTLGWIVTLNPLGRGPAAPEAGLLSFFTPERSVFVFAFLGAYLFGIGMLFRRYVRSDLTPEAFAHFAIRAISAVLIAWAVSEMLPLANPGSSYLRG